MEVKDVIDALDPKMKEYKEQLKAEVTAIDAKHEARVSEINEDVKKKGEMLVKAQEQIAELAAKNGKLKAEIANEVTKGYSAFDFMVKDAFELVADNVDKIKSEAQFAATKDFSIFQTKDAAAMTLGNNLTGTSQISYVPNSQMRSFYSPHLYNIFQIVPTATGNVTFPRATSGTGEGSFGDQTEGEAKALVDYDVTMVNTSVPFVAGRAKISRQMTQDLPFMTAYLTRSLTEDWNRRYNVKCLNTIATNATALSTSETVTAAKMIAGIAQHGNLGLGDADLILTTYAAWSTLLLTKPSDYSIPGGVTIDANGNVRIAGIPIVRHQQVATSRFYVINTNAFATAQASGLSLRSTETNEDDFNKNMVSYRLEARVELLSYQPTSAVYGTTGTA